MRSYKRLVNESIRDSKKQLSSISITHYGYAKITYEGILDWELIRETFNHNEKLFGFIYDDETVKFESTLYFEDGSIGNINKDYLVTLPGGITRIDEIFEAMFKPIPFNLTGDFR